MKKPNVAAAQPIYRDFKKEQAARDAKTAATLDLKELDDSERAFLATCQKIYRRWTGGNAPFEDFFYCLVLRAENHAWPTPQDVEREMETFKENFDNMQRDARNFLQAYPNAAPETVQPTEAVHAN